MMISDQIHAINRNNVLYNHYCNEYDFVVVFHSFQFTLSLYSAILCQISIYACSLLECYIIAIINVCLYEQEARKAQPCIGQTVHVNGNIRSSDIHQIGKQQKKGRKKGEKKNTNRISGDFFSEFFWPLARRTHWIDYRLWPVYNKSGCIRVRFWGGADTDYLCFAHCANETFIRMKHRFGADYRFILCHIQLYRYSRMETRANELNFLHFIFTFFSFL